MVWFVIIEPYLFNSKWEKKFFNFKKPFKQFVILFYGLSQGGDEQLVQHTMPG